MAEESLFPPETAGGLMVTQLPTAHRTNTVSEVVERISKKKWDDIYFVYVLTQDGKLIGLVPLTILLASPKTKTMDELMIKPLLTLTPETDQEKVVIEAIKLDIEQVPVVDHEDKFLGVVVADRIIDVLHDEHLEDFLRSSGIRGKGSHILELAGGRLIHAVQSRIPWLLVGLGIGLGLSLVSSRFEGSLQKNIALAYFIPVIAYVADSVGTQSETIFIRASTVLKLNLFTYLLKEFFIGSTIGVVLGIIGGIGGALISQSISIGLVVGVSLFCAITVSAVLACVTPICFTALKKDPALGSGPLTTAIQDLISITIYFLVAGMLLH